MIQTTFVNGINPFRARPDAVLDKVEVDEALKCLAKVPETYTTSRVQGVLKLLALGPRDTEELADALGFSMLEIAGATTHLVRDGVLSSCKVVSNVTGKKVTRYAILDITKLSVSKAQLVMEWVSQHPATTINLTATGTGIKPATVATILREAVREDLVTFEVDYTGRRSVTRYTLRS